MDPLKTVSTRQNPQSERADERQVPDSAGGYGFALDDDARVRRFLTLGTTGGTFYAREQELTAANADVVLRAARARRVAGGAGGGCRCPAGRRRRRSRWRPADAGMLDLAGFDAAGPALLGDFARCTV
jgi:hypothetical protein